MAAKRIDTQGEAGRITSQPQNLRPEEICSFTACAPGTDGLETAPRLGKAASITTKVRLGALFRTTRGWCTAGPGITIQASGGSRSGIRLCFQAASICMRM